jgi:hypothetical protein
MSAASSLEAALALAARGFSIIPVPRPQRDSASGEMVGGKIPDIKWGAFQERRAAEREIRAWFGRDQNIGIVTGAISGVVVVDADSPAALTWIVRNLPRTPWQTRTAKGFHLYYRHPGTEVRNRARLETRDGRVAVDVRGDGGFVVGPGSLHASAESSTSLPATGRSPSPSCLRSRPGGLRSHSASYRRRPDHAQPATSQLEPVATSRPFPGPRSAAGQMRQSSTQPAASYVASLLPRARRHRCSGNGAGDAQNGRTSG